MSRKKKLFLLVLLVAVVGVVLLTASKNGHAGNRTEKIICDGLDRTYIIYIPFSHDKRKSVPLVIALHGGGGTGKDMVALTRGGFNTLSDKEGFIVVYPDGTKFSGMIKVRWNDGRDERYSQSDDVGFISVLIDHLVKEYNVDSKRVYATGISNGAHMSMRLARELSGKIAAVAPVAYAMQEKYASVPVSTRPISVLVMTGTKDPFIPWEGGETPDPSDNRMLGKILSVPATVNALAAHNKCSSTSTVTWEPDRNSQDGTLVRRKVYSGGKNGTEVILYAIEGGGHTWPGGQPYLPKRIIGKTSKDIDANKVIWNFFKKHSR